MSSKKVGQMLGYGAEGAVHREVFESSVMAETQTKTVEVALDPPGLCTEKRLSLLSPVRRWWVWNSRTSVPGEDGNPHRCFGKLWLQKVKASPAVGPSRCARWCSGPEHVHFLQERRRGFHRCVFAVHPPNCKKDSRLTRGKGKDCSTFIQGTIT